MCQSGKTFRHCCMIVSSKPGFRWVIIIRA
ncbi:SEC-C metal-binding domain-containing protein [Neptuniibacter caesariensis]